MKWEHWQSFVQNVPAMAVRYPQDAVWEGSSGTGRLNVGGPLPCRHSRIVPVKGHDEVLQRWYRETPFIDEKKQGFLYSEEIYIKEEHYEQRIKKNIRSERYRGSSL